MGVNDLMGNSFMGALGVSAREGRAIQTCFERGMTARLAETATQRMRALTEQYDVEIKTSIPHCPECPHCKKIKREATVKALKLTQQILDKKEKYKKRCADWVEKIRKLTGIKKESEK